MSPILDDRETPYLRKEWMVFESKSAKKRREHVDIVGTMNERLSKLHERSTNLKREANKKNRAEQKRVSKKQTD